MYSQQTPVYILDSSTRPIIHVTPPTVSKLPVSLIIGPCACLTSVHVKVPDGVALLKENGIDLWENIEIGGFLWKKCRTVQFTQKDVNHKKGSPACLKLGSFDSPLYSVEMNLPKHSMTDK